MKVTGRLWLASACAVALLGAGCGGGGEAKPETLFGGDFDDGAMEAAMEAARGSVGVLVEAMASGTGESHAVKVAVSDTEATEHFWLTDVVYADGVFTGAIGNDPGLVSNVAFGDERSVAEGEISDWMYLDGEMMYGNYTLRVLLPNMEPEQAAMFEGRMAPLPE